MQLSSADATMFSIYFFAIKKLKKPPSKVAQKLKSTFFPYCPELPHRRIHVLNCGL